MPLPVEPIAVRGEWIRHVPHRAPLLGRSAIVTPGRWQGSGGVHGLYLADDRQTAIAEWYRWLAERALPPHAAIPLDHHRWTVELEVADLSTAEQLEAVGLDLPRPSQRTWTRCQTVGERLRRAGWCGVLSPSAARPGSLVLCVFCERWPPAGCTPMDVEQLVDVPPPPVGMTT